jgi:hypothetical protein
MNGPRVQVTLPSGKEARGTLIGPAYSHGPSSILVDSTWPARLVDPEDWDYLPAEEQEASCG